MNLFESIGFYLLAILDLLEAGRCRRGAVRDGSAEEFDAVNSWED